MITPRPEDIKHKLMLIRLLRALEDNDFLAQTIYLKGGTGAALFGYLDRFSVDLDFDIKKSAPWKKVEKEIQNCIRSTDFIIKNKSKNTLFYLLKYPSLPHERNSLKLSFMMNDCSFNIYEHKYLPELGRYIGCQTIETMFSHKLIALTDRYVTKKLIAVRDLYDIHHFFEKGYRYIPAIIEKRSKNSVRNYLQSLIPFIQTKITDKAIQEDLSYLLIPEKFKKLRKTLKDEALMFIRDEVERLPL